MYLTMALSNRVETCVFRSRIVKALMKVLAKFMLILGMLLFSLVPRTTCERSRK